MVQEQCEHSSTTQTHHSSDFRVESQPRGKRRQASAPKQSVHRSTTIRQLSRIIIFGLIVSIELIRVCSEASERFNHRNSSEEQQADETVVRWSPSTSL